MIISELVKIEYTNDNSVIEQRLFSMGIQPLRWAVVKIIGNEMLISVSYVK